MSSSDYEDYEDYDDEEENVSCGLREALKALGAATRLGFAIWLEAVHLQRMGHSDSQLFCVSIWSGHVCELEAERWKTLHELMLEPWPGR